MTCFKSKLNQLKSKYFKMASANKKKETMKTLAIVILKSSL